ncbi:glycosyltransferase family 1 protein [Lentinula edodes]|uniref:Glycosyltransferase family 1 protein n=1 Tax=Lentinula edodes TaxID=5353 RepID=A0A1Q3DZX0_LENED|nr:glycosyltransferase family 1 protein [Lentinula edodes]
MKAKFKPYECNGEVLNIIPGLAPLFDYEWFPQKTRWSNLTPTIEIIGGIHIRGIDGLICASSPAFEAPAIAAARNRYMSLWKIWHNRGSMSDTEKRVVEFLNQTQNEFGEKSLVYISFGTIFFPSNPEKV